MEYNNSLQNIKNYKNYLVPNESKLYFEKYVDIINQFLLYSNDHITINDQHKYKFVIMKGMEILNNVFNIILLYTKNIDTTYFHSQKAYYYYSQFINQIGDESNSFLKLNSRDALFFVYRKTVFELNQDYRKTYISTVEEEGTFKSLNDACFIYNNLFFTIFDHHLTQNVYSKTMDKVNKTELIKHIITYILNLVNQCGTYPEYNKLLQLNCTIVERIINLVCVNAFTAETMPDSISCVNDAKLYHILDLLNNKIIKYNKKYDSVINRIESSKFTEIINTYTALKLVNYLLN
jgi:hypothetical protein